MHRRFAALALGSAVVLAGCGFALRQAPHFAFESLYVSTGPSSTLGNALKRSLASNAQVKLVTDAKDAATAQAVLDIVQDQTDEVIIGKNSAGQVVELKLRHRVRFKLHTPAGKELIPESELLLQRNVSFTESAALAKEAEKNFLYRDMLADMVQQLQRRLAAVSAV